MPSDSTYIKPSDLARACEVDLKTIHNWIDRGALAEIRTPGGHRRIRRDVAIAFLTKHEYAIPAYIAGKAS